MSAACTCNPRTQITWVNEDCPTHGREFVLDEPCGEELRATYDREDGSIWISCTRHAGHDGLHEDEHYGTKCKTPSPWRL